MTGAAIVERDGGAVRVRMPTLVAGRESKVLWRPQTGYQASVLHITATRLDAAMPSIAWSFPHATLDRAGTMDGGYPSGITLPSAGCWRLTAHLGRTDAGITIQVRS